MGDVQAEYEYVQYLEETKKDIEAKLIKAKKSLFDAVAVVEGEAFTHKDGEVTRIVRPVRKTYDWDKIKSRVGALKFKKIVKQVPDETLLTQAISNGTIDMKDVAGCVIEKETTAYVRTYAPRFENGE